MIEKRESHYGKYMKTFPYGKYMQKSIDQYLTEYNRYKHTVYTIYLKEEYNRNSKLLIDLSNTEIEYTFTDSVSHGLPVFRLLVLKEIYK